MQDKHRAFPQCGTVGESLDHVFVYISYHTHHTREVFHQYVFEHVLVEAMVEKKIYHMFRICKARCVCVCAFLERTMMCILWHKIYRRMTFVFGWCSGVADA